MVFPIVGGDGKPTGYEIDNSLRFNSSDTARLGKTISGTSNRKTFSMSFWLKKTKLSGNGGIFGVGTASSDTGKLQIRIDGSDNLKIEGGATTYRVTDREFRDVSAWYNIFISFDSTQSTADNRVLIYVNGVQETSFSTSNNPSQDANTPFNEDGKTHYIGTEGDGSSAALDGYLAEFHYIDGTKKAYTDFGEFNDNGVWIPKEYDGSYGTHGFYFQFKQTGTSANSSGMGADTSGNDNHYTPNNLAALDVTVDTPTNNFATMNPVHVSEGATNNLPTFSEGNLKIGMNSDSSTSSTIAPASGKWYVEYKQSENTADNQGFPTVGISATLGGNAGDTIGFRTPSGTNYRGQLGTSSVDNVFLSAREANDIFGFYIDLDNSKLIVHKNGSNYMNTGYTGGLDWSSGLTTTGTQTGFYHFYVQNNSDGSPRYTDEVNFGNPTFSISSSNSDANGYGSFEYSPTLSGTNYYAMCTKNLAEYG